MSKAATWSKYHATVLDGLMISFRENAASQSAVVIRTLKENKLMKVEADTEMEKEIEKIIFDHSKLILQKENVESLEVKILDKLSTSNALI